MSVLDTNFDSPREMPTRDAWLDNASAQLLNDNSYYNAATRGAEPAWLGKVDLFDSARTPAAYEDAPAGDTVPVPQEPTPEVPTEPPHTPEGKPVVEIEQIPAGETPQPPIGPRAVEGPPPPGAVPPEGLRETGPHQDIPPDSNAALSRGRRSPANVHVQPYGTYVEPGPGPDGRNADGTYGAGHHPYTPQPYVETRSPEEMTKYYKELHKKRMEEPAPYVAPRPDRTAILQALVAAAKRDKDTPTPKPTTGQIAHADPNYVPPAGSFGGFGRRGG